MQILINHIGYDKDSFKKAVIEAPKDSKFDGFIIKNKMTGKKVFSGKICFAGPVYKWKDWCFWTLDFSEYTESGTYFIEVNVKETVHTSYTFTIEENLTQSKLLPYLMFFFKTQRCSGIWDEQDHQIPFVGDRTGTVDVHGGWYDASGDRSKYLSHLAYANYMNPQQIPIVVLNMYYGLDLLPLNENEKELKIWDGKGMRKKDTLLTEKVNYLIAVKIIEEACYGADFLVRMQDPEGYFYMTIFDKWTAKIGNREICSYETQFGVKKSDYQAGYRQGAGIAIAALAKASMYKAVGEYDGDIYLAKAIKGFDHLEKNNVCYLNDGKENIIDDYCALMAAVELYSATKETRFLEAARKRSVSLMSRISTDENYENWWRAGDSIERPYFHGAESGLPVISLIKYYDIETDDTLKVKAKDAIQRSILFELSITNEVNNPFGYPRQYVKSLSGPKRGAFFIPHENETGYWWQGENARIASLSVAARLAVRFFDDDAVKDRLKNYAQDQINWILGLNPYDMSSLYGFGHNYSDYEPGFFNIPGGICNGITGGLDSDDGIDYLPEGKGDVPEHRWRWSEQWIPHPAWFFYALCCRETLYV